MNVKDYTKYQDIFCMPFIYGYIILHTHERAHFGQTYKNSEGDGTFSDKLLHLFFSLFSILLVHTIEMT